MLVGLGLLLFRPNSLPFVVELILVTWVMLVVSLYLFIKHVRKTGLAVAYAAVIADIAIFCLDPGFSQPGELLFRLLPDLTFLIAAHFAYKSLQEPIHHQRRL
jgi:hypothetical protein